MVGCKLNLSSYIVLQNEHPQAVMFLEDFLNKTERKKEKKYTYSDKFTQKPAAASVKVSPLLPVLYRTLPGDC